MYFFFVVLVEVTTVTRKYLSHRGYRSPKRPSVGQRGQGKDRVIRLKRRRGDLIFYDLRPLYGLPVTTYVNLLCLLVCNSDFVLFYNGCSTINFKTKQVNRFQNRQHTYIVKTQLLRRHHRLIRHLT